jgi:hypothetical protein
MEVHFEMAGLYTYLNEARKLAELRPEYQVLWHLILASLEELDSLPIPEDDNVITFTKRNP